MLFKSWAYRFSKQFAFCIHARHRLWGLVSGLMQGLQGLGLRSEVPKKCVSVQDLLDVILGHHGFLTRSFSCYLTRSQRTPQSFGCSWALAYVIR